MNPWCIRRGLAIVCLLPVAAGCSSPSGPLESIGESAEALGACNSSGVQVADVEGDLRDLWAGREVAETGKEAQPDARIALDFNVTVDPNLVVGQFIPIVTDGTCGGTISTTKSGMVVAADTWGKVSSNATRPTVPSPYNLFTREAVSGIPSVAGAIAAGGDITLSSFGVNGTARRTVGLTAGARVVLANGSVFGNVTYGTASTIPQSVSVTGTKTLAPFAGASAFPALEGLSTLLAEEATTGTVQSNNGTLQLNGTKSERNIFRVSSDAVAQAHTIQITVPTNAGVIVDVTGGSVALENKTITLQGVTPATLLWNLAGATSLRIGSIGLQGSVLAPRAPLSMPSGSINGTVVVRSFTSPGSGSLLHAPLNTTVLFASTAPSSVELRSAQSLVRGCTYDFLVPRTRVLTTGGGCLGSDLRVRFRVAKTAVSPAGRELVSAIVDPTAQTLRTFEARPGINTLVPDVLKRYQTAIGVLPDELVPTGAARPSSTVPGESFTSYQQVSRGYPVFGYGYLVASANGIFRSANGQTMPNLPAFSSTPITSAAALQAALTHLGVTNPPWVTNPATYLPPVTTLGIQAKRADPSPADFRLVWDVRFYKSGVTTRGLSGPGGVTIDAVSGAVLGKDPAGAHVTPLDPNATYVEQTVNTVDALYGAGLRAINVARYRQPNGQLVTTLANNRVATAGMLTAVHTKTETTVEWVTDPTPSTPWGPPDNIEQGMATAYWQLQATAEGFPTLGFRLRPGTTPWTKFDGAGTQITTIRWWDPADSTSDANLGYDRDSDATAALIHVVDGFPGPELARGAIAHEVGHVFLANVRRASGWTPEFVHDGEAGSINEALSDLFGITAIHGQFGEVTDWHCQFQQHLCVRSPSDPLSRTDFMVRPASPFPNFYKSAQFLTAPVCDLDNDYCFIHHNSTVISFWGYMLAVGSERAGSNVCDLKIDALDPDTATSLRMMLNIAYLAAGTRIATTGTVAKPTFAEFRDATIRVSRELALQSLVSSEVPRKVELAWFAVGLGPASLSESTSFLPNDKVSPAEEATSITPWQNFMWPMEFDGNGNAKAWDFQLADGPFATSVKVEKTNYLRGIEINGERKIFLPLALPFDSAKQYFWRVRPVGGASFAFGCYPVHSFQGTTQPGTIANINVLRTLAPDGKVEPSIDNYTVWNPVEGATQYKTYLATDDPLCTSGSDIKETTRPNDPVTQGNSLVNMDLEPSEHYWLNVQPIGPPDFAGNPSLGACYGTEFETSSLGAPAILAPANGTVVRDDLELALAWTVSTGSESSRLSFYEIDQNGNCETTPVLVEEVPSPCNNFTCTAETRTIQFTPPNPTGYCWEVTAIAGNGVESAPSAQGRFRYLHGTLKKLAPGVQEGVFVTLRTPALLPGKESYGKGVTFSWNADPYVAAYAVRLWKYEVNAQVFPPVVVDPPNCGGATTNHSCSKPKNVLLQQTTSGTSLTVPESGPGSRGRYCWDVWPLMGDLGNLSVVSPRQPLVSLFPSFCYTSAPAEPKIVVDNPPGTTFSSDEITGHIEFPYVPDYQLEIKGNSDDISFGPMCTVAPDAYLYFDLFDCKVSFTIEPNEQQTYKIRARTFNSDAPLEPVMDDSTEVHDIERELKTGNCGAKTEPCCPDETCDPGPPSFPLACHNDVCLECGNGGEPCCAGNTCPSNKSPGGAANLVCSDGQCKTCGIENGPCCTTGSACKQSNIMCEQGTCKRCGVVGATCCPTSPGVSGKGCGTDGDCKSGKCAACGDTNQPCCFDGNPMGLCNKHPDTTSCVLGPKTCQACGHKGQPCCSGAISGGLIGCNPGTSCGGDMKCQACGRPGEPCCLSPQQACFNSGSVCQSNLVCSGAPPSGSANLSFSSESPLYAPVAQPFPPGTVINVRVCNNGTAPASAFVQADVLSMHDFGIFNECTFFGVQAFASGWLHGTCNGNPDSGTLYQPTIQPGSCETYILETFYLAQGIYDWVFSINGSGTGAIESVYQCINTQPPACVRTL